VAYSSPRGERLGGQAHQAVGVDLLPVHWPEIPRAKDRTYTPDECVDKAVVVRFLCSFCSPCVQLRGEDIDVAKCCKGRRLGGALYSLYIIGVWENRPWKKCVLLCCTSVIVRTENTISDRFICFILTLKRRWRPVFWGRQLKKRSSTFSGKKSASGQPGRRIFWPRNDLAPLLRWRRHW